MNDPQIWTVLGVFGAVMFGALGLVIRYTASEIRALDTKHEGRHDLLVAQIAALGTRIDTTADGLEQRLGARIDGVEQRIDSLEQRLDTKIDSLEQRLDAKIDGAEQRLDAKIDHLGAVLTVRIDGLDHRLGTVEDDLKIVKAHLLRHPAA